MSLTMWTPVVIASKATQFSETLCRFVVKNARSSIAKITDTDHELILVESSISRNLTTFEREFRDLHPLLQLPFMAKAYQSGSRFRAQFDSGVGSCVAMLSPSGFVSKEPTSWDENWSCIADSKGARWFNTSSRTSIGPLSFTYI